MVSFLPNIRNIKDVVDWGLCTGCGACQSACTGGNLRLVNIEAVGIRPQLEASDCANCVACLNVCPGYEVDGNLAIGQRAHTMEDQEFGPALEIWEGYAIDSEIRRNASSGGVISALALYCLENEGMGSVFHTAADPVRPWANKSVRSGSRQEILNRAGSRYAPASPCDMLDTIEAENNSSVFIGKPCDTAAATKMRQQRQGLDRNLGLVLSFFCAGTPSGAGTLELLKGLGVDSSEVKSIRYRGEGWPGFFKVVHGDHQQKTQSYRESWGLLSSHRASRCHLCPDGLGRVSDIACGDAWDKLSSDGDCEGLSLIIVRTQRGRAILHKAMAAGYISAKPTNVGQVIAAQPNLLARRPEIFGRLLGMKLLGMPVPRFPNFSLYESWIRLPLLKRLRTVFGTMVRLIQRGQWRRRGILFSD